MQNLNLTSHRMPGWADFVAMLARWSDAYETAHRPEELAAPQEPCARESAEQVHLGQDQVWGKNLPAGTLLQCLRGAIWITRDGDREDSILRPGEQIVLARPAHVVASALGQKADALEAAMLVMQCEPVV